MIDQLACFENKWHSLFSVHTLVNIEYKLNVRKIEFTQQIAFSNIYHSNANDFDLKITKKKTRGAESLKDEKRILILLQRNKTTTATINKQERAFLEGSVPDFIWFVFTVPQKDSFKGIYAQSKYFYLKSNNRTPCVRRKTKTYNLKIQNAQSIR